MWDSYAFVFLLAGCGVDLAVPLASQSHCGVDLDSCAFSKSLLLSLSERAVVWT